MLEVLSNIKFCAILAALLGLYIGYLLAKESCNNLKSLNDNCH